MRKLIGMSLLLLALVAAVCIYQLVSYGKVAFFDPGNLYNLAQRIGILGIYAIGAGIVILSGGIDLSIGSIIGFVGVVMAMTVTAFGASPWLVAVGAIVLCAGFGLWHGFLIGRFNLQPFVVTLCTLLLLRGLARGVSGGASQRLDGFAALGNGSFLGLPIPFWLLIGIALVVGFFMNFTVYGRYLYAIGRNAEAVRYSGINVNRMRTAAYVTSAVLSGIAGVVSVSYTGEVQPASAGLMFEMWAIAAAVLGGCSLRGGEGSVIGVIIGAALIKVMYNGINLIGISTEWEWAVIGVVILGGVIADAAYGYRKGGGKVRMTVTKGSAALILVIDACISQSLLSALAPRGVDPLTAFANSSTAVLVAAAVAAAFALAGAVLALWALARKDGTIPAALALCVVVGAVMIRFARALQP